MLGISASDACSHWVIYQSDPSDLLYPVTPRRPLRVRGDGKGMSDHRENAVSSGADHKQSRDVRPIGGRLPARAAGGAEPSMGSGRGPGCRRKGQRGKRMEKDKVALISLPKRQTVVFSLDDRCFEMYADYKSYTNNAERRTSFLSTTENF